MVDAKARDGGTKGRARAGVSRRDFVAIAGMTGVSGGAVQSVSVAAKMIRAGREFRIFSPADAAMGFGVGNIQVHHAMGDHINAEGHLAQDVATLRCACRASGQKGDVLEQLWQDVDGHVRIHAMVKRHGKSLDFNIRVDNGYGFSIRGIRFDLPAFTAPAPQDGAVLDACCGGRQRVWQNEVGNDGLGYYRYSSLVMFYDKRSTGGVCVEYFDDELRNLELHWQTQGDQCRPWLDCGCFTVEKGQSAEFGFRMIHYAHAMPEIAMDDYRRQRLAPFMARYAIQESPVFVTSNPWAQTGWPFPTLEKKVAQCKTLGAHGYIQWAPPDGQGIYEPFPERLAWFGQMKRASRLGVTMGVLIDPNFSPRVDQSAAHWALDKLFLPDRAAPMAYGNPMAKSYLLRLRNNLAANGVRVAFWDTGGLPYGFATVEENLTLLQQFRQSGIRVMPEVSRDHTGWITGVAINWNLPGSVKVYGGPQFTFRNPPTCQVLKRVTPNVKMFRGGVTGATLLGMGQRRWWQAMESDGATIFLLGANNDPARSELGQWAQEHGVAARG